MISLDFSQSTESMVVSHCGLNRYSPNTSDVEHLFVFPICLYSFKDIQILVCFFFSPFNWVIRLYIFVLQAQIYVLQIFYSYL